MLAEGGRRLASGKLPSAKDLLLTPGNAKRVTAQLAEMRGAAMKLGQMLSMDGGDLLPPELAEILSRLRASAYAMPTDQLHKRLSRTFGKDWRSLFAHFNETPIAAASIGQVHRAKTLDGANIVLKIQYPGVAKSIDSDIDNVATLLRVAGLIPKAIDIQPLLDDAKAQLRAEADYAREAKHQQRFANMLKDDPRFLVPKVEQAFSGHSILAMDYVNGIPIENVAGMSQARRNEVATAMFELLLRELFELHYMQTDPNFANYLYDARHKKIILLDFGATRRFNNAFAKNYMQLFRAAMHSDDDALCIAAGQVGYSVGEPGSAYRSLLLELFNTVLAPFRNDEALEFPLAGMMESLGALGERARAHTDFWQAPPADALYLHRKVGGMYLLASRLEAHVNVHRLLQPWLNKL
ncbi:MAG: AarF/ABC1/UbiB kinase family protein [Pseudomonadales bacterium]|nr:AarF/ABC1/UbiB kinase family protein [Pseudomonadales bacterium]